MMRKWNNVICRSLRNEKGLTLIELLAVIVILGIMAGIAIPAIGGLIENQKKNAFVANALTMKEAANLYVQKKNLTGSTYTEISYKKLVTEGFLEEIIDPDTRKVWDIDNNESYVKVTNLQVEAVCLKGDIRKLCGNGNNPINFADLSKDLVVFYK